MPKLYELIKLSLLYTVKPTNSSNFIICSSTISPTNISIRLLNQVAPTHGSEALAIVLVID